MQKITIVGAGNVGAECARRSAEKELGDVVLIDVVEGLAQGKALDMLQASAIEKYSSNIIGTNDYKDTANSDVVIITAGLARKPGMSRDDLLMKNAEITKSIVEQIVKFSPNCTIIMVTNPLDVMTYLALKASKFPKNRVLGMAALLDEARMETFLRMASKAHPKDIKALVLGSHGDLMVPLADLSKIKGESIADLLSKEQIEAIVERTKNGGAEIVALLKSGSAYYAPSASAVAMAQAILKNEKKEITSAVLLEGEYGLKDVCLGVPCVLGKNGAEEIREIPLKPEDLSALKKSAENVKENIGKIENFCIKNQNKQ